MAQKSAQLTEHERALFRDAGEILNARSTALCRHFRAKSSRARLCLRALCHDGTCYFAGACSYEELNGAEEKLSYSDK